MQPLEHGTEADNGPASTSRRRVVGLGIVTAGAAWVTPTILSVDAASAATDPPPPATSSLSGVVTECGHEVNPGDSFLVTATQNPGGAVGAATTDGTGAYVIGGLPAGTYDVLLHPNGTNTGAPDEGFKAAVVLVAGVPAVFNPDYQAAGC